MLNAVLNESFCNLENGLMENLILFIIKNNELKFPSHFHLKCTPFTSMSEWEGEMDFSYDFTCEGFYANSYFLVVMMATKENPNIILGRCFQFCKHT